MGTAPTYVSYMSIPSKILLLKLILLHWGEKEKINYSSRIVPTVDL